MSEKRPHVATGAYPSAGALKRARFSPARPPRMPQQTTNDWRLVRHLNRLNPRELLVLVRSVERRYHKLVDFEAQEIRRAQALLTMSVSGSTSTLFAT